MKQLSCRAPNQRRGRETTDLTHIVVASDELFTFGIRVGARARKVSLLLWVAQVECRLSSAPPISMYTLWSANPHTAISVHAYSISLKTKKPVPDDGSVNRFTFRNGWVNISLHASSLMTDYSTAITLLVGFTVALTAGTVFVLRQPTDLPTLKQEKAWNDIRLSRSAGAVHQLRNCLLRSQHLQDYSACQLSILCVASSAFRSQLPSKLFFSGCWLLLQVVIFKTITDLFSY